MRASVRAGARPFNAQFEGTVPEMYADDEDLVTAATGNLADPFVLALGMPWLRRSDGQTATHDQVLAEFWAVKQGKLGWYPGRKPRPIYLSAEGIQTLFFEKLDKNEGYLARRWSNWASAPADAQLLAHSCAWAAGAAWYAPHFDAAFEAGDWQALAGVRGGNPQVDASARGHAWLNDQNPGDPPSRPGKNPGLRPRNLANVALAQNAAVAVADGRDIDVLYWPTTLDG